jgi:hypothetical protein
MEMTTLVTFFILALPLCEDTINQEMCARHVANECVIEQIINPGYEPYFYIEGAVEALPKEWWPE